MPTDTDFKDLYTTGPKIYFEDIELDNRKELGSFYVAKDDVINFALEWDPQPFHTDEEAAKASLYGGLTGSSIHMLAVLSKKVSQNSGNLAALANLSTRYDMPTPMRVDDTLFFHSMATEKRLSKSREGVGIVSFHSTATNQRDEIVMQHYSTVMMACRPT